MADFHAGRVIFDADLRGMQKVDAQLEQFRIRQQRIGRGFDKLYKEDYTKKFTENLKRGFESGFNTSIAKGENQMYAFSHAIGVAGSALNRIKSPVENAAESFQRLQKTGYQMQTGLGLLFSTIGDLGGGILGLVGVVGQALPAFVAFGGAIASVGSGFVGVKIAMSGVSQAIGTVWKSQTALNDTFRAAKQEYIDLKFAAEAAALSQEDAAIKLEKAREALARVQDLPPDNRLRRETELQFKQAELNYRETAHKSNEAYRAVKKGITATSAYQPLASLNAFQLGFVKFIVAFRPQMLQLTKIASEGFIPKLTEGISTLMKTGFPVLEKGIAAVASAMGDAFKIFVQAFKVTDNLTLFSDFFKNSIPIIKDFGTGMGSAFGILLNVLKAAAPLTKRFADWVDKYLSKLNAKVYLGTAGNTLVKFFNLAGNAAAGLGKVFGNIKNAFLNIIKASFPSGVNSGAGGVWLSWLDKITKGFQAFTGNEKFSGWLKNTAKNATTALSTIGQFLKIFLDLAGQKSTREFFLTIRQAVPYIRQIFLNGGELSKTLGSVLVSLAKLVASLADAGTLRSFFNTIAFIADAFSNIVVGIAPLLNFIGYSHGAFIAIVGVITILKNFLAILMGYLEKASRHVATLGSNISSFRAGLEGFNLEMRALDATQKIISNGSAKDLSRAFAVQALRMNDLRGTAISAKSAFYSFGQINKRFVDEMTITTASTATAMQKVGRGFAYIPAAFKTVTKAAKITMLMSKEALREARAMAAYEEARQMGRGTKELAKRELQVRATSAAYKSLIDVQRLEMEARLAEAEGNHTLMAQKIKEISLIGEGVNAIQMDEAAAKELAATYVNLATDMKMSENELTILRYELDQYIATNKNAIMTNEQMVASSQTLRGYDLGSPQRNPGMMSRIRGAFRNPTSKLGAGIGLGAVAAIGEIAQSGGLTVGSGLSAAGMGLMLAGPEMLPASIALTAVGGIVDSIQNGIQQQAAKIKEIRIQNANIYNAKVVDRSNFNREAYRSGAFKSTAEANVVSGKVDQVAKTFEANVSKVAGYTGAIKTQKDLKTYFSQILTTAGSKSTRYLSTNNMLNFLGNSAGQLSQATGMNAEDLGTSIGVLAKSSSVALLKQRLLSSNLVTPSTMKNIPDSAWTTISKGFVNGQLTNSAMQTLINAIIAANTGQNVSSVVPGEFIPTTTTLGVVPPGATSGSTAIIPIARNASAWKKAAGQLQAGARAQKGTGFTAENQSLYASLISSLSYGKATELTTKRINGYLKIYAGTNEIATIKINRLTGKPMYSKTFFRNQGNALKDAGITGQDLSRFINLSANTASQAASTTVANLDASSIKALNDSAGSSANAAAEIALLNTYFQKNFVALPDMMAVLVNMEKTTAGKKALAAGGTQFMTEFQKELKSMFNYTTPTKLGPNP